MRRITIHALLDYVENFGVNMCRVTQFALICLVFVLVTAFGYFFLNQLFAAVSQHKIPSWQFWIYFVSGIWILYNIIYNYIMAYRVGPGSPDDITSPKFREIVTRRCRKCNKLKPERCHHCSICNRCALQMDHHCPWLGTCIGYQNRRFFINFLTYLNVGMGMILVLLAQVHPLNIRDVYAFLVAMNISLGAFTLFHWLLVLSGKTTLELCFIGQAYQEQCNFRENIRTVFGSCNPFLMFLPISPSLPLQGFEWNAQFNVDEEIESVPVTE